MQEVTPTTARPLPKDEWKKRKDRGNWSYKKYRTWWAKNQGKKIESATMPTGGVPTYSPQQYGEMFNSLYPDFSGPLLTPGQMRSQAGASVSSTIDPVIQQISDAIGARSKAGADAIRGYTETAAQRLGGIAGNVENDYSRLKAEQAAVDNALAGFVGGESNKGLADLEGMFKRIGADPATTQLGGLGQTAAGDAAALGSAALSRLIGNESADLNYARELPAFQRGIGGQQLGLFQGDMNRMFEEQIGDIKSQVPGLVESMYQTLLGRDMQQRGMKASRGGAATSFIGSGLDRSQQAASIEAAIKQRAQEMGINLGSDISSSTATDGGFSDQDLATYRAEAGKWALESATNYMAGDGFTPRDLKNTDLGQLRKQIAQGLRSMYAGSLTDAEILEIATQAVIAATGYAPGQNPYIKKGKKKKPTTRRDDPGTGSPPSSKGKTPPGTTSYNGAAPPAAQMPNIWGR